MLWGDGGFASTHIHSSAHALSCIHTPQQSPLSCLVYRIPNGRVEQKRKPGQKGECCSVGTATLPNPYCPSSTSKELKKDSLFEYGLCSMNYIGRWGLVLSLHKIIRLAYHMYNMARRWHTDMVIQCNYTHTCIYISSQPLLVYWEVVLSCCRASWGNILSSLTNNLSWYIKKMISSVTTQCYMYMYCNVPYIGPSAQPISIAPGRQQC